MRRDMVLVPHKNFVEMVGFAKLLDDQAPFFAMEHLKLALRHHPCPAALLEWIEQTELPRAPRIFQSRRIKKLANWLFTQV